MLLNEEYIYSPSYPTLVLFSLISIGIHHLRIIIGEISFCVVSFERGPFDVVGLSLVVML